MNPERNDSFIEEGKITESHANMTPERTEATPQGEGTSEEKDTTTQEGFVMEKVQRDNTKLYSSDGTVSTFDSPSSASGATHLADAEFEIIKDEDRVQSTRPEGHRRVTDPKYKDIVGGVKAPKKIASPYLKNTGPDARAKDKSTLDDADLLGVRQGEQAKVHNVAELVKIKESISKYDQELRNGKVLTEEEYNLLKDAYLRGYDAYAREETYYSKLNLPEKDKKLLLENHFKEIIEEFNTKIRDENGNFNSSKLKIEQLLMLKEAEKKKISSLHRQDRTARQEESSRKDLKDREEQYKKDFEEKHGIPWSLEAEKLLQRGNLLERERDLYKEAFDKKSEGDRPQEPTSEEDEPQAPTPEEDEPQEPTPEEDKPEEKERNEKEKQKRLKRWAIVAGIAGAGTAILGGTGVGVWAAIGGAIVAGGAGITGFIGRKRIERLKTRMIATEGEERAKIEKKIAVWNKVLKVTDGTIKIARGFALGAAAGNLVSHFFMGGKGLIGMYQASKMTPTPEGFSPDQSPTGQDPSGHANPGSRGLENPVNNTVKGSAEIGTPEINTVEAPTINTEGVLVRNGRVDLPGSAWNGNMAGAPITGGELSPSSFAGGATNMGAFNLEKALTGNGLTREAITQNLTTPQIHSLLNTYQANPSTSLTSALGNIGTEGAQNLIQMISGN